MVVDGKAKAYCKFAVFCFQKADVYSFAILLQQIILRSEPFELPGDPLEMSVNEILKEVIRTQTFFCECLLWVQIIT